jgi:hypothetical protein
MLARVRVANEKPSVGRACRHGRLGQRRNRIEQDTIGGDDPGIQLGVEPLGAGRKAATDGGESAAKVRLMRDVTVLWSRSRHSHEWHDDLVHKPAFRTARAKLAGPGNNSSIRACSRPLTRCTKLSTESAASRSTGSSLS